jgi:hypothetical protein
VNGTTTSARLTRALCLMGLTSSQVLPGCGPRFMSNPNDDADPTATAGVGGTSGQGMTSGAGGAAAGRAGAASSGGVAGVSNSAGSAGALDQGGAAQGGGGGAQGGLAGGAGNTDAGGQAGAGGVGPIGGAAGGPGRCLPDLLIDDMEDGDDRSCPNQQRDGEWWTSTGTLTGVIDPPKTGNFPAFPLGADARPQSRYGMRLVGTGFGHEEADWASLGFNFVDDAAYDVTAYTGLAFYAKSKTTNLKLHVEVATDTTTSTMEGGACQASCNDHYEMVVTIDGSWREYSVAFGSLTQEGWGMKPQDLAHARFVYFGFVGADMGPANFEFLIDDVRLY